MTRHQTDIVPAELDRRQHTYKEAVDRWIAAIREEEALATPDHSIVAWERWEQAGFKALEAQEQATVAKEAYKDGLRRLDYNI
ncbi:MAG: hypothetical protein ABSB35_11710 [Bryobacteraceae bacterium]|jgi:hypothetical protein